MNKEEFKTTKNRSPKQKDKAWRVPRIPEADETEPKPKPETPEETVDEKPNESQDSEEA